jgi:hypothetical protein
VNAKAAACDPTLLIKTFLPACRATKSGRAPSGSAAANSAYEIGSTVKAAVHERADGGHQSEADDRSADNGDEPAPRMTGRRLRYRTLSERAVFPSAHGPLLFAQGDKSAGRRNVPKARSCLAGRNAILRESLRLSVAKNDAGRTCRAFDLILRGVAEPFRQMLQNRDVFAAGGTSAFFPLRRTGALALRTPEPRDETVST